MDETSWLSSVLGRVDRGWLVEVGGLVPDGRTRSGIRRISATDVHDALTRLITLYRAEQPALVGVARRSLGEHHVGAEDVVQEVMRKLCQNPRPVRSATDLRSYVYAAVRNESRTWGGRAAAEHGRRAAAQADEGAVDIHDEATGFDDGVVFQMIMARALAGLSPRERELVELVDIQRLTLVEAAARLGIALGTAKNYRHTAHERLREDPGLVGLRAAA